MIKRTFFCHDKPTSCYYATSRSKIISATCFPLTLLVAYITFRFAYRMFHAPRTKRDLSCDGVKYYRLVKIWNSCQFLAQPRNSLYVFFQNITYQSGILINIATFVLRVAATHLKILRVTNSAAQLLKLLKYKRRNQWQK